MSKIKDRIGEIGFNNNGEKMTIVRYGSAMDIDVQFEDGTVVEHRIYGNFKKGNIKNPMFPIIYGVGFIGVGNYSSTDENGKPTKCYDTWHDMHKRCYDSKFHKKRPTYENCTICEEWYNHQVYAKWFEENYYEIEGQTMALDKDILNKGNKVYSPDTCIFVPVSINVLFTKRDNKRGELPIGTYKHGNKFQAHLSKGDGKQIHLGTYDTVEEAFLAYKIAKEKYIKEVAEEYKDKIPYRLYEAMMNYEVEIDD